MADKPLSDRVNIPISCPECGQDTKQTVGWLKAHNFLDCIACGHPLDLTTRQNRTRIERLFKACNGLDGPLDELS